MIFRRRFLRHVSKSAEQPTPHAHHVSRLPELVKAVQSGDLDRVRQLVEAGADLEQKDERGSTAIHYAACDQYHIAEYLLSKGADIEATDCDGLTPVNVAFLRGDRTMLELLVKHGANINKPLPDGRTPMVD